MSYPYTKAEQNYPALFYGGKWSDRMRRDYCRPDSHCHPHGVWLSYFPSLRLHGVFNDHQSCLYCDGDVNLMAGSSHSMTVSVHQMIQIRHAELRYGHEFIGYFVQLYLR